MSIGGGPAETVPRQACQQSALITRIGYGEGWIDCEEPWGVVEASQAHPISLDAGRTAASVKQTACTPHFALHLDGRQRIRSAAAEPVDPFLPTTSAHRICKRSRAFAQIVDGQWQHRIAYPCHLCQHRRHIDTLAVEVGHN